MIIVLSPHGDDAELAMGATMAALAARGERVRHVVMTTSQYKTSDNRLITSQQRRDEAALAASELGVEFQPGNFVDNDLIGQLSDLVRYVDELLEAYQPTDVYTCLPWFNEDHTALYKATLAAMRRMGQQTAFWGYEMPAQELGYRMPEAGWFYSIVDKVCMNKKLNALMAYQSQNLIRKSGPVSLRGSRTLAELRGCECGAEFAERQLLLRGVCVR
jgi:LmbE family N-acetylglucosaminyl deacetylase